MGNDSNIKQRVRVEVVDASGAGQRIDNFLLKYMKGVPKSHLYKLLRKGQVRVNGKRIRPPHKLGSGDRVRIPPVRVADRDTHPVANYWLREFAKRILYEDEQLLVIDKPAGIPVHRGTGVEIGVIDVLRELRSDVGTCYLVHRLDRDTSGCLLLAKNRDLLLRLQALFHHGGINKQYLALTNGRWTSSPCAIDAPLLKNTLRVGDRMMMVDAAGKRALSRFHVEQSYTTASLVRVTIETGRTHQIRVHARHAGHPIAGDRRYGDNNFNRVMRELGLKRIFLHAARIEFALWDRIVIECPLPDELNRILFALKTGRSGSSHG